MRAAVLRGLAPSTHVAHPLHAGDKAWVEKNCYTDLWIELIHALGLEPRACLPFVFGLDFEGDQWTFFKPPLAELRTLYGIDVQELTVWRPLLDHALEHLGAGKWIAVEVDAFWLPDTAGTDYRQAHAKTTVVLNEVDTESRRLGYFHNAGYCTLEGEDFEQIFSAWQLPPYAELIRLDRRVSLGVDELRSRSAELFGRHLAWRPTVNPVRRFGERLVADLPMLQAAGLSRYHRWAFAGVRQLGAGSELASLYLDWLLGESAPRGGIEAFERIAQGSKTLLMKCARAVNSGRPLDASVLVEELAQAWEVGMRAAASASGAVVEPARPEPTRSPEAMAAS